MLQELISLDALFICTCLSQGNNPQNMQLFIIYFVLNLIVIDKMNVILY